MVWGDLFTLEFISQISCKFVLTCWFNTERWSTNLSLSTQTKMASPRWKNWVITDDLKVDRWVRWNSTAKQVPRTSTDDTVVLYFVGWKRCCKFVPLSFSCSSSGKIFVEVDVVRYLMRCSTSLSSLPLLITPHNAWAFRTASYAAANPDSFPLWASFSSKYPGNIYPAKSPVRYQSTADFCFALRVNVQ